MALALRCTASVSTAALGGFGLRLWALPASSCCSVTSPRCMTLWLFFLLLALVFAPEFVICRRHHCEDCSHSSSSSSQSTCQSSPSVAFCIVLAFDLSIHWHWPGCIQPLVRITARIRCSLPGFEERCRTPNQFHGGAGCAKRWPNHQCHVALGAARLGRRFWTPPFNRRLPSSRGPHHIVSITAETILTKGKVKVVISRDLRESKHLDASPAKAKEARLSSSRGCSNLGHLLCLRNHSTFLLAIGILRALMDPFLLLKVLLPLCNSVWRHHRLHLCQRPPQFPQIRCGCSRCNRCQCWMG